MVTGTQTILLLLPVWEEFADEEDWERLEQPCLPIFNMREKQFV
jgi:hypothetical protein